MTSLAPRPRVRNIPEHVRRGTAGEGLAQLLADVLGRRDRTHWSIVLPMMRPALLTLTILSFQGAWNEFPHTLVAVQSPRLFTLPRGLADLVSGSLGAGTQFPLNSGPPCWRRSRSP